MVPECHFFFKSWEYKKGLRYYSKKWFEDAKNEVAIGERSSSYLFGGNKTAKKIFLNIPNVKLIFCIRNPIERAWASYRFTVLQGYEDLSFIDALKEEKKRILNLKGKWKEIQHLNYTGRGMYFKQLNSFLKIFPKKNIHIIKSEFMREKKEVVFENVFKFLNVDSKFHPKATPDFVSFSVKDRKKQCYLRKKLKGKMPIIIENFRKELNMKNFANSFEDKKYIKELEKNLETKKLTLDEDCRFFLRNIFKKEILSISKIVDFDIKEWQ